MIGPDGVEMDLQCLVVGGESGVALVCGYCLAEFAEFDQQPGDDVATLWHIETSWTNHIERVCPGGSDK